MTREELLVLLNTKKVTPESALSGIMEFAEFTNNPDIDKIPSAIQNNPQMLNMMIMQAIPYLRSKYEINSLAYSNGQEFKYW